MARTVRPAAADSVRSSAGIDTAAQVLLRPYISLGAAVVGDLNPDDLSLCPGRRRTAFSSSLSVAPPGPRDPCGSGSTGQDRTGVCVCFVCCCCFCCCCCFVVAAAAAVV